MWTEPTLYGGVDIISHFTLTVHGNRLDGSVEGSKIGGEDPPYFPVYFPEKLYGDRASAPVVGGPSVAGVGPL